MFHYQQSRTIAGMLIAYSRRKIYRKWQITGWETTDIYMIVQTQLLCSMTSRIRARLPAVAEVCRDHKGRCAIQHNVFCFLAGLYLNLLKTTSLGPLRVARRACTRARQACINSIHCRAWGTILHCRIGICVACASW